MSDLLVAAVAGNAAGAGEATYVEDVFSTYLYSGQDNTNYDITNGIALGSNEVQSLANKTVTNLGTAPSASYPLENLANGRRETSNGQDITYWSSGGADFYVDLGEAKAVNAFLIAPQGNPPSTAYNTPQNFDVRASTDGSSWTNNLAEFRSITTGDWNPGTFREFSFSNTTEYRYWRYTTSDSTGLSISELAFKYADDLPEAKGGLVWIKQRNSTQSHLLFDTERGVTNFLQSDTTLAETTDTDTLISFNSNGFSLGPDLKSNDTGDTFASWTFAKQEKFFDVVTYTGTGTARTVSHNLGSVPGCIIVKRLDATADWQVYHRGAHPTAPEDYLGYLQSTIAFQDVTAWNDTAPTSTEFTLGAQNFVNANNGSFVAYLFAHNDGDGEFGENGDQDIIKCGSFTASTGTEVDLGFEPQFILTKASSSTSDWYIFDTMRGWSADQGSNDAWLEANDSAAEYNNTNSLGITPTGFTSFNGGGLPYIYIAIRRGPMKTPESGTEVFALQTQTPTGSAGYVMADSSGFPIDWIITRRYAITADWFSTNRLTNNYLIPNKTNAQGNYTYGFDLMEGVSAQWDSTLALSFAFRRAPGFFDMVAYEGNGGSSANEQQISHNLGVKPDVVIIKRRDSTGNWWFFTDVIDGSNDYLYLNLTDQAGNSGNNVPTESVFNTGGVLNTSGADYIAFLFATLPGVSKVGRIYGDGTNGRVIDCGFTNGARFVMMKKAQASTGNWIVYNTERGIVAGNDPYLFINSTAAEVTNTDFIDPDPSGFAVNASLNTYTDTWIFLAIA